MNFENPATRLLNLLQQAKTIPANTSTRDAWASLLGTQNAVDMWSGIARSLSLVGEVKDALEKWHPEGLPSTNHWTNQIQAAFQKQNFHSEWSTFLQPIDAHTLSYLDFASRLLDGRFQAKSTTEEERDQYRTQLNELMEEVLASDQPPELKEYLVRSLRKVLVTLDEYKLTGGAAVIDAVQAMFGGVMLDEGLSAQVTKSPMAQKIFSTVAVLANTVTIATGGVALAGPAMKLLGI